MHIHVQEIIPFMGESLTIKLSSATLQFAETVPVIGWMKGCVYCELRRVRHFVTVHMFCASRDGSRYLGFLRNLPTNTMVFLPGL